MTRYRSALPQLDGGTFLSDGGLETTLVFLEGLELPCFAAFPLVEDEAGRMRLDRYIDPYIATASERGAGFVLDTPTWRANRDWGAKLGYEQAALDAVNRMAVEWAEAVRARHAATAATPIVINGVLGPRGDGYRVSDKMTAETARRYHGRQIEVLADTAVDMVSAMTMNYAEEAMGIALAAQEAGLPVVISFTVETDGRLASGEELGAAIERVDDATGGAPAYYMINCAHPAHFESIVDPAAAWTERIRGLRANASMMSHAELDEASELDAGDPVDLGRRYRHLRGRLRRLSVLGGCCGTDHRHIRAIHDAWAAEGSGQAGQASPAA